MIATLIGHMMAPSIAFTMLSQALIERGIQTISLIGAGKSTKSTTYPIIYNLVAKADVVLLGMSGPKKLAEEELLAAEIAATQNIPFGFYADTYNVFHHSWINQELRDKAAFLFLPVEEERKEAQILFPNAEIVVSGNPTWEDFFSSKYSREQVRDLFMVGENEKLVLCSMGTIFEINLTMLKALDEALTAKKNSLVRWKIIIGIHPGDQNYRKDRDIYKESFRARVPMRFVARNEMATMDIIPGANYIVDTVGSSIGINAACLRKPVICYCSEAALNELEKSTGKRSWKPWELGVIKTVYNTRELTDAFDLDFSNRIKQQKNVYPAPLKKGQAIKIMAETLQRHGTDSYCIQLTDTN